MTSPDDIREKFARALSAMYRAEVPQYGALVGLVAETNAAALAADGSLRGALAEAGELDRIDGERHGAIRLGTAGELATMRRLFAVMGMVPVGFYDLSASGVPVHSTAFRPVNEGSLRRNPFRVFTSLLRLELIADGALRAEARAILSRRRIFSPGALAMIERFEREGGLTAAEADLFVREALETFRWHDEATVDAATYRRLLGAHRLVADVVCFRGPHINHLTPRTLDIDAVQRGMPARGLLRKDVVEGPPARRCPVLLRQTSFAALGETVRFPGAGAPSRHEARFGEVEQRGQALTPAGRALYDRLLDRVRSEGTGDGYPERLETGFREFPDDAGELRRHGLGFFRYGLAAPRIAGATGGVDPATLPLDALVEAGVVTAHPLTYEDFLPVSAAGIFRSNLGGAAPSHAAAPPDLSDRGALAEALGAEPLDEMRLYADAQARSVAAVRAALRPGREAAA